jgi:hypothetical protein
MKFRSMKAAIVLMMSLVLNAQPQAAPAAHTPGPGEPGYRLPSGVTVMAELTQGIDVRKVAAGDEVHARVEYEVRFEDKVIIPLDSKITGHVYEVRSRGKDSSESRLRLAFEKITLKNGQDIPFEYHAFVAAVGPDRRDAIGRSNHGDLPVQAERGTAGAVDSGDVNRNILGDRSNLNAGMLMGTARGVIGFRGMKLVDSPQGPTLVSTTDNIKFEYGAQMVLIVPTPVKK